jgi:N-acetyltransferase
MRDSFNINPGYLRNEIVRLLPLDADDFETLYTVASDPLIWAQHPNPDRYKREVFQNYFEGALASNAALRIQDRYTDEVVGCTRFYNYDEAERSVYIGYTFFACKCWGKDYNFATKVLMLNHAFEHLHFVRFEIGANNIRSQKAIEKLGAAKVGEKEISYYGEAPALNFIYEFTHKSWHKTDWFYRFNGIFG